MKNIINSGASAAPAGKYPVVLVLVLLIVAGNVAYWYLAPGRPGNSVKASPASYSFFTVSPAMPDIYSTGVIKSDRSAKISPPVAGIVRRVAPERFAAVRSGDVLIELDARQSDESLRQEKFNLENIKVQLSQAKVQLRHLRSVRDRYEDLARDGVLAAMTVDEARTNVSRQEHEVRLVEQRLDASQAAIRYLTEQTSQTSIQSPIDGIVTDILVTEGQFVAPGGGSDQASTLLVVSDTGNLFAQLLVDEIDVSRIRVGQEIELQFDALPGQQTTGRIEKIAPAPNNSPSKPGVNFEATVSLTDRIPQVRIGMTVFAVMRDTQAEPRRIPAAALQSNGREKWVWQLASEQARKKTVTVGDCTADECVLLTGLESGATIIAGPVEQLLALREGQPVALAQ